MKKITLKFKLPFFKLNFFKFLKIKKSLNIFSITKNLQIFKILIYFFLEKNRLKKSTSNFWTLLFKWNVSILHKKTVFLQKFRLLNYFNKKYFPQISSKRFLKKLFGFRKKKFFKNKLKKINFFFLKKFFFTNKWKIDKWNWYFLAWDAYFSIINLKGFNIFFFRKNFLNNCYKKLFFDELQYTILKKLKPWYKGVQFKLSKILSTKLKKIYLNKLLTVKLKKFKKKIFSLQLKADSFYKIFKAEFHVPYQNLFFWKSIIWFSTSKYLILPTTELIINNFNAILFFFKIKFEKMGLEEVNYFSTIINWKETIKYGFNFFNTKWLEIIVNPLLAFFSQHLRSFFLSITYQYVDFFFLKKKFLPINLKKFLKKFLMQNFNFKTKFFLKSKDIIDNKLLTIVFYNIINEIFFFFFNFSPAKITFLDSKPWLHLFFANLTPVNLITKNWEFLNFYSKDFLQIKNWFNFSTLFLKNKKNHKLLFYDFFYFLRMKKIKYDNFLHKIETKIERTAITNYLAKNYFPLTYLWPMVNWRFFYMRVFTKFNWLNRKLYLGKPKIVYDAYMTLQNKFWPEFFFLKTSFERILQYGFTFRSGMADFNLDWNFLSTYKGNLAFKLNWKIAIKINKKNLMWEKIVLGYFTEMWKNPLFFSFFSFLNWAYLLQYTIQFGHTKSTYNTSYKDYLIMVYNERFILNVLNIQLNLKWNLKLMFKMFYLGGFICLVGAFNILLDGLVGVYGCYSNQPYTWFIWINGLFSNFDKIFKSIQIKVANAYASWVEFTRKMVKWLIWLWFTMWGLLQNLTIDISFFPSLFWSSWVFLESSAWFYPTITISNTECFLPTVFLEYTIVSNDYSLLALSFYINMLLITFKKSWIMRQSEFSVYPQKLLAKTFKYKILPIKINLKYFKLLKQIKVVLSFLWKSKYLFFELTKTQLTEVFKYLFIYWKESLNLHRKQNFWRFFFFKQKKNPSTAFLIL